MAAPEVRISFEQTLTFEAPEITIEGPTIRNGAKLKANGIRLKESVKLREDP